MVVIFQQKKTTQKKNSINLLIKLATYRTITRSNYKK